MEVAQPKKIVEEYLIDILRDRSIPLEQIMLVKGQPISSDDAPTGLHSIPFHHICKQQGAPGDLISPDPTPCLTSLFY